MSPEWRNHTGNQRGRPQAIEYPSTLGELVALVQRAEAARTTVRAVGAHHAWSDAALTEGFVIEPDNLGGLLALDDGTLRDGVEAAARERGKPLVRVAGGTHLHALNDALDAQDLALPNMGGYDAQTIAGVVSTSTHGSGLGWGPFPDMVRSLELVIAGGEVVRVEPVEGPSDRQRFAAVYGETRGLIPNDATFEAALCAIGTLGVIHSLVLEVRPKFWLNEVRTLSTWEAVRDTLTPEGVLGEGDHYELFVNPYTGKDGAHRLVVTRRGEQLEPPKDTPQDKLERHPLTELESRLPITGGLLRLAARHWPSLLAWRFDAVLVGMQDDGYTNVSHKVFNIGEANKLPAISMELGVALEGNRHLEAVDRILAIAQERRQRDRLVHTSPFALRFVAPSRACASMMHERATMMIELIMVHGTRGGEELLAVYEQELADLDVRPHWGQLNALTGERIAALYPRWNDWLAAEAEFNRSGVFESAFTRRIGIESHR